MADKVHKLHIKNAKGELQSVHPLAILVQIYNSKEFVANVISHFHISVDILSNYSYPFESNAGMNAFQPYLLLVCKLFTIVWCQDLIL